MPFKRERGDIVAPQRSELFLDVVTDLLARGCHVRFRAAGTSMQPTIRHAEHVTVAPVDGTQLAAGDVILCDHRRGATAHRIVAVHRNAAAHALWTRGDNADQHDGPVAVNDVIGRVVSVRRNGAERRLRRTVIAPRLRQLAGQLSRLPMNGAVRAAAALLLTVAFSTSAHAQMVSGTYTGDGTDNRDIVSAAPGLAPDSLGFTPDVVIVKAETAQVAVIRSSTMIGDLSKPMTGATAAGANMIQALVNGGFQVGSDARVNGNGTVYHFVAFKAAPGKLKVGTYTGNGAANRIINGLGFSTDVMFLMSASATEPIFGTSDAVLGAGVAFDNSAPGGLYFTAVSDDGFTLGSALAENNATGATYHYVAWNEVDGQMAIGNYNGNGGDNRSITGFGFRPEYVIVKQTGEHAVQHMASMGNTTDQSLFFDASAQATNRIQELLADGIEVGSNNDVNENGVTTEYIAWGRQLEGESQVVSGSYTGNGADNRVISGLTFTPEFIIVKGNNTQVGVMRSMTMNRDETKPATGATTVAGNLIQELRESSFVIGNDARVNSFGVTYQWVAFRSGDGEMQVGQYVGTGTDNRNVTGVGFQPDIVMVMPDGAQEAVERSSTIAGDSTYDLGNGTSSTNQIQALQADGFQVGTNGSVNTNGALYHYVAWKATAGKIAVGSYAGNNTDGRNFTGIGFQPELVMVRRAGASAMASHPASLGAATDSSQQFLGGANFTNAIQALQADGFQVGTSASVNSTGSTYHWMAWKQPAVTAVRMRTATATLLDDGRRMIDWHTGFEVNNLGFNVYRGDGKNRVLLTPVPVAGSALMLGKNVKSRSGFSYRWIDSDAAPVNSSYWIEDVDLSGATSMYGPLRAEAPRKDDGKKGDKDRDKDDARRNDAIAMSDLAVSPLLGSPSAQRAAVAPTAKAVPPAVTYASVEAAVAKIATAVGSVVSNAAAATTAAAGETVSAEPQAKRVEMVRRLLSPAEKLEVLRKLLGVRRDRTVSPEMRAQWKVAGGPAARVVVRTAGWYRISQAQMIAGGIDPATDPRLLQLFLGGVEQALVVNGGSDGRLDPQDSVEFYGEGADTPYSDSHVYWLVAGSDRGARVARTTAPAGAGSAPRSFAHTVETKARSIYFAALLNGEDENFFGAMVTGGGATDEIVRVVNRDAAGTEARLEVQLQGVSEEAPNPDHTVTVLLNGYAVGVMTFDGRELGLGAWDINPAWLVDGDNVVSLEGASPLDVSLVDRIRLTYSRLYTPESDRLHLVANGNQPVVIGPFSNADVRVIDVTDTSRPVELLGKVTPVGGGHQVRVQPAGTGPRTLEAFVTTAALSATVENSSPSTLNKEGQSADLVIISHAAFLSEMQPLKELRERQGHRVTVVDVQDVYDEFSFGEKTPFAIRRFLSRAQQAWRVAPRFVLLVGNATNDPRDYYGFGEPDFVPTKLVETAALETASDDWFADLDDDGVAEAAILGRLPVRSSAEAHAVVSKIVDYEQADALAWSKSVMLVADTPEPDGFDFQKAVSDLVPLVPSDYTVSALGTSITPASNGDVLLGLNNGQAVVNFVGHGSVEEWGSGLLTSADAAALTNGSKLPFVVAMNCLNGFFQGLFPEESLAESLLRAPNGGAVAVWASSAVTSPSWQAAMNRELFKKMFGGTVHSAGEAIAAAKSVVGDPDVSRSWIFFGDPLTRLKGMPEADPFSSSTTTTVAVSGASGGDDEESADADDSNGKQRMQAEPRRLADFNGDGLDDAVVHDEVTGIWQLGITKSTGTAVGNREGTALGDGYPADLNGDGRIDMVWYDARTGAWTQALNERSGRFTMTSGRWAPGWTVRTGDFDGDGRADVLLYDEQSGIWFQCLSDGAGHFYHRAGSPLSAGRPYVADFNGDRLADLFVHDAQTGQWTIALGNDRGSFTTTSDSWDLGWSVMPGDLNGDGRTDLVLWNARSSSWIEALTRPAGGFAYRANTRTTSGQPHVVDLNGDGREDVLWHDARLGRWSLRVSRPSGTFATYQGQWEAGWDVLTGNFDATAGLDLMLHNPDDGSWRRVTFATNGLQSAVSGSFTVGRSLVGRQR